ncbi:hypothetical protein JTB14_031524 [Gonioctena quinquepunctata]|nr:hypothetical protein JTB14_031524 [Gonioctena quinquepunctata]
MNSVSSAFEESFPEKSIVPRKHPRQNWHHTPQVEKSKKILDILFVLCQNNLEYRDAYRERKKQYNILASARKEFHQSKILESENKSEVVKEINGSDRKQKTCMLEGEPSETCNDRKNFFDMAKQAASKITSKNDPNQNISPNFVEMTFNPVTPERISDIIKKLKSK